MKRTNLYALAFAIILHTSAASAVTNQFLIDQKIIFKLLDFADDYWRIFGQSEEQKEQEMLAHKLSFYNQMPNDKASFKTWIKNQKYAKHRYCFYEYHTRTAQDIIFIDSIINSYRSKNPELIPTLEQLKQYLQDSLPLIDAEYKQEYTLKRDEERENEDQELKRHHANLQAQALREQIQHNQEITENKRLTRVAEEKAARSLAELVTIFRNFNFYDLRLASNSSLIKIKETVNSYTQHLQNLNASKRKIQPELTDITILVEQAEAYKKAEEEIRYLEKEITQCEQDIKKLTKKQNLTAPSESEYQQLINKADKLKKRMDLINQNLNNRKELPVATAVSVHDNDMYRGPVVVATVIPENREPERLHKK